MKRCYSLWSFVLFCSTLLLTGCSLFSHTATEPAQSTKPASTPLISNEGVADLNASTPVTLSAIDSALHQRYQLLEGMQIRDGKLSHYIEARKDGELALTISGDDHGIKRIVILDPALSTFSGVSIGTPFSRLFHKAYNVCQRTDEILNGVLCRSPDNPQLRYLFNGSWQGPDNLLPADDVLRNWTVRRIIWQKN